MRFFGYAPPIHSKAGQDGQKRHKNLLRDGKTVEPEQVALSESKQTEEITAEQPVVVAEDSTEAESVQQEEQPEVVTEEPAEPVVEPQVTEPVAPAGKQYYIVSVDFT